MLARKVGDLERPDGVRYRSGDLIQCGVAVRRSIDRENDLSSNQRQQSENDN